MEKKVITLIVSLLAIVLMEVHAAGIPQMINYQGILLDSRGNPATGDYSIEFLLYDVEADSKPLWFETQTVTVADGLFNVLLGSVTPIPAFIFETPDVYLALKVETDEEMMPRKRLVSVAYAFHALNADSLGGRSAGDFVGSGESGSITEDMIVPSFLSSVDGVSNDGGNIDLIPGSNITITPNDGDNTITISADGGSSGDNLGNHIATQNIRLNGHWLSNDGGNEGIEIDNSGNVSIPMDIQTHGNITAVGSIQSNSTITAVSDLRVNGGYIRTGTPASAYTAGDIAATDDLYADDDIIAGDDITAGDVVRSSGNMVCGDNMTVTHHLGVNYGGYNTDYALRVVGDSYLTGYLSIGDKLFTSGHCGINFGGWSDTYALRVVGSAYCTGSWQSSDLSLKKNITTATGAAAKVLQLKGVAFEWKKEEYPDHEFDDGTQYGMIAQEVEAVYPELVKTDENGEKAVNYIGMIPLLLEAVKAQQQTIDDLKLQVERLSNR
jgi:hypothetical protein